MHGKAPRALSLALLIPALAAVAVACTQGQSNGLEQANRSDLRSVERSAPSASNEQLVFPQRGFYVRWTPGSHRRPAPILPVDQMDPQGIASAGGRVYWLAGFKNTLDNTIRRVSLNGRRPTTLVRRVPSSVSLAATRQKVFWASSGAIGRVSVDGTHVQRRWLVIPRQSASGEITDGVYADGRFLYLSQCFRGRIGRVPLTAHHPRRVDWIARGINTCPSSLVASHGFIFWAGSTLSREGVVGRASIADGTANDTWTRTRSVHGPHSVSVANGFVYWDWGGATGQPHFIGRVSMNGSKFTRKVRRIGPYPITATLHRAG